MKIKKILLIVGIVVLSVFIFIKSQEVSETKVIGNGNNINGLEQSYSSEPFNDTVLVPDSDRHPPLVMTEEQFNKIMKDGLKNGVVYTSLTQFDEATQQAVKEALRNLNEKGSISGGIKLKEFSDLNNARENLREKTIDKILSELDGFKSIPNEILEQHHLMLTGAQSFGSYNEGDGWSGIYKLYENKSKKVEIEQIYLKPNTSTQQLIVEALNTSLSNDTPAIYEQLPSDLIEKLTFVNDRNYYQINGYNLSKNEIIEIANEIIKNPQK